ncbi:zinc finger protein 704 isoform 3-T4 [Chlamydotis macqueenii]
MKSLKTKHPESCAVTLEEYEGPSCVSKISISCPLGSVLPTLQSGSCNKYKVWSTRESVLKVSEQGWRILAASIKREMTFPAFQQEDVKSDISQKLPDQQFLLFTTKEEDLKTAETKKPNRAHEYEKENTRSVCLLEQKRKVVSSNIDVPPARKSSEELDMDKVTAAMVLTSLSTSPLVRSPPVRPNESLNGSWKEGGFVPSSTSSSGYWSWNAPSDQSNPSTPSPPLSADSFKAFRTPSQPDDGIDEAETSNLLFDEPIPRKRKNSMKVMFKCLWKNCGKVLSTAAGIQKHIRTIHLGRVGESDYSDGEEDFYYTEIRLNTDSVADGLSSLSPVSPSLASPPSFPTQDTIRPETSCAKTETKLMTPLSRSAPTNLYLVHTDHAYQATPPVNIPGSAKFTPNGSSFSISWQSPPVTFTGIPVSPTHNRPAGSGEQKQSHTVLSSPPRVAFGLRYGTISSCCQTGSLRTWRAFRSLEGRGKSVGRSMGWRTEICGVLPADGRRPAKGSSTKD